MITDHNGYLVNKSNTQSGISPVDIQSVMSMEILEGDMAYVDIRGHDVSANLSRKIFLKKKKS